MRIYNIDDVNVRSLVRDFENSETRNYEFQLDSSVGLDDLRQPLAIHEEDWKKIEGNIRADYSLGRLPSFVLVTKAICDMNRLVQVRTISYYKTSKESTSQ